MSFQHGLFLLWSCEGVWEGEALLQTRGKGHLLILFSYFILSRGSCSTVGLKLYSTGWS